MRRCSLTAVHLPAFEESLRPGWRAYRIISSGACRGRREFLKSAQLPERPGEIFAEISRKYFRKLPKLVQNGPNAGGEGQTLVKRRWGRSNAGQAPVGQVKRRSNAGPGHTKFPPSRRICGNFSEKFPRRLAQIGPKWPKRMWVRSNAGQTQAGQAKRRPNAGPGHLKFAPS